MNPSKKSKYRLNVLGSYVVMKLLEFICPAILPIPFSLYFDFFDGFIQALYLYSYLLYLSKKLLNKKDYCSYRNMTPI